ncbi:MAG: hypothetical protein ACYTHM_22340, partial [Planctomycetota bacterium]
LEGLSARSTHSKKRSLVKTPRKIILAVVLLFSSTGCRFLTERAHDWEDSFRVSVSAGLGAKVHFQVGPLGFGAGYWDGYEVGFLEDQGMGVHRTSYFGLPIPFNFILTTIFEQEQPMFVFTHRDKIKGWGSNVGLFHLTMRFYEGNRKPPSVNFFWYEIDLRFFVGFRFAINLAEFADFLLGFFGLDILGDDRW